MFLHSHLIPVTDSDHWFICVSVVYTDWQQIFRISATNFSKPCTEMSKMEHGSRFPVLLGQPSWGPTGLFSKHGHWRRLHRKWNRWYVDWNEGYSEAHFGHLESKVGTTKSLHFTHKKFTVKKKPLSSFSNEILIIFIIWWRSVRKKCLRFFWAYR